MKFCILTHNFPLNENDSKDAGVFVKDFAQKLQKKGNDVFVFVPNINDEKEEFKNIKIEWFEWMGGDKKIGHLSFKNPFDIIKLINLFIVGPKKLENFVKENKIDKIISMWAIPSGYFAYKAQQKTGVDYAIWALGSDINKYAKIPILKRLIVKILKKANILFADGIELTKNVENIANKKCVFLPSSRVLYKNIKPAKIDKMKTNFLFIGRLEKVKGVDVLIKAMIKVFRKKLNCKLYILGDGILKESLEKLVSANNFLDKIIFKGNASPEMVSSYLQSCDCLIIPSRSESIPLVFGEALQFRKPLIVSDVGDLKYLVDKYKVGYIFSSENEKELENKIFDFCSNKFEYNSDNFEKANNLFDIDETVNKCISLIKNDQN